MIMTKQYLIEQINRVSKMITEQQSAKNIELLKQGRENEISFKMRKELDYIHFKYNKHRKLESATKETLSSLLEECIKYGFDNEVKGFDSNFTY